MVENLTDHERYLMEKMTPRHRVLIPQLSPQERQSLSKNIKTAEDLDRIQTDIGSDAEIEKMLFGDSGGKFDDPEWGKLEPLDDNTRKLYEEAALRLDRLNTEAVACQRRSDLTLLSQFNSALLFSGLAGAVRCNEDGLPDSSGRFFRGIELRCIGSVGDHINTITIRPDGVGRYVIHFGPAVADADHGIEVNTHDPFSLIQLAYLVHTDLPRAGYAPELTDGMGPVSLPEPSEVRQAIRKGVDLGLGGEIRLRVMNRTASIEQAFETAVDLARVFYKRFGMETEIFNISRRWPNMFLLRNEQFDDLLSARGPDDRGLVFMTYTLECRRCRRELAGFTRLAAAFPKVKFAMINMNAPHVKFQRKVFGDATGGKPNDFAKSTTATTPFSFVYKWRSTGGLTYKGFVGTAKDEPPPSLEQLKIRIEEYVRE